MDNDDIELDITGARVLFLLYFDGRTILLPTYRLERDVTGADALKSSNPETS